MKKIFILFLAGVFLIESSILYSAGTLSLDSLVKEAREKNPEILAAKKNWEASLERIPQAKSLEAPTIGLTFEKMPGGPFQFNKAMSEDRMLSISQFLPLFGKLSLKGKIALVESQMFAAEYKSKELEIINAVKNAYYDLFMNYKEIELNEQSLEFLKGIANIAEAKYVVGNIPQEELFKINLEIASLSNKIVNLNQEQTAKKARLNTLLNRDPESPLGVPELSEDVALNKDINSLYKFTLENQPEVLIFSYAIERNKYAKSLAERNLFPDLMAGITLRGITAGSIGLWDLMLAFTMPFWFWTKQRYEIKEAIANLDQAKAAYEAMKNRALFETKDLATKIEVARNNIGLYKNSLIPLVESSIGSSIAAFRSGKGDLMTLLDNERMLIETEMNYYNMLVEYNTNLADLERTVGLELTGVDK